MSFIKEVQQGINKMKKILYPSTCVMCGQVMNFEDDSWSCLKCSSNLQFLTKDNCQQCGKPLTKKESHYCFDCSHKVHTYNQGRALWPYEGQVKNAITLYKFQNQKNNSKFFSEQMLQYYINNTQWKIDLITSVPLHKEKLKQRTYNQAALIADSLGNHLNVPINNNILIRKINTKPQKELTDIERVENLKNAFEVDNILKLKGKNILIIDDIYTTGSTIDACTKVLKEKGADKVYFMVLAIGRGY